MEAVSHVSFLWFLALVGILAVLFVWSLAFRVRLPGDSRKESPQWFLFAFAVLALWLGPSGIAATKGLLTFEGRPPTFFVLLVLTTLATTVLAFSPVGTHLVRGIGIAGLVGFQAFRAPLELLLHRLHQEGALPIQMTFEGRNYDIVTGALAGLIGIWALMARPPRVVVWVFNLIGVALLVNIVTIAILSMPTPLRLFFEEPAPSIVLSWPFVWLPTFLVQAAWFGHLLVFRRLLARG